MAASGADELGETERRSQADRDERLMRSTKALEDLERALARATKGAHDFAGATGSDLSSPGHPARKGPMTSPERK